MSEPDQPEDESAADLRMQTAELLAVHYHVTAVAIIAAVGSRAYSLQARLDLARIQQEALRLLAQEVYPWRPKCPVPERG